MTEPTWGQRLGTGALSGAGGGVLSALVLGLLVEPVINKSIAIEHARNVAGGHDHGGGEIVTRHQQQIGGLVTVVIVAVLFGLAFAVIYGRSAHRMPGKTELGRSLALAAIAFFVAAVMPALAIPADPPAVGDPATVHQRTLTYLATILFSVLAVGAVFALDKVLAKASIPPELRWLAGGAACVSAVIIVLVVVPEVAQPIPSDVPAALIWQFRVRSLAQLGALWAGIGILHGVLSFRLSHRNEAVRELEYA